MKRRRVDSGEQKAKLKERKLKPKTGKKKGEEKIDTSLGEKKSKKSSKKSKHGSADSAEPKAKLEASPGTEATQDEQQRRALQREIQQLVMRLRSEGKTPAEIKSATKELKAKSAWTKEKLPTVKKDKQRVWEENAAKKRKEHLQTQHDLVIIPVVWRGRHDKLDVLKAAEDIKACLSQQGLDVWLDSRRHLTPGQKFAHWEHRGVLLRVEIGPEDLKAGVCQVCLAHTPGDYKSVERKRVALPPRGTRSLLLRLKEWGLEQLEVERRAGDSEDEAPDEEAPDKVKQAQATTLEDVQGNWIPRVEAKGAKAEKAGKRRKKKV